MIAVLDGLRALDPAAVEHIGAARVEGASGRDRGQARHGAGDLHEALRIGLVNGVVAGPELMAKCKDIAGKIAKKGKIAVAQCKRVMFSGADLPLDNANALEIQAFAMLFGTNDRKEGMSAFVEKRQANFTGR